MSHRLRHQRTVGLSPQLRDEIELERRYARRRRKRAFIPSRHKRGHPDLDRVAFVRIGKIEDPSSPRREKTNESRRHFHLRTSTQEQTFTVIRDRNISGKIEQARAVQIAFRNDVVNDLITSLVGHRHSQFNTREDEIPRTLNQLMIADTRWSNFGRELLAVLTANRRKCSQP